MLSVTSLGAGVYRFQFCLCADPDCIKKDCEKEEHELPAAFVRYS